MLIFKYICINLGPNEFLNSFFDYSLLIFYLNYGIVIIRGLLLKGGGVE